MMQRLRQWAKEPDLRNATAVFVVVALLLTLTASQGFVRDEGYYFKAARLYQGWFEGLWQNLLNGEPLASFDDATLRRAFSYNTEHPGFVKLAMGWTWRIFCDWLGITSHATGYRLASILLVSLGAAFLYLFGARYFERRVGVLAVALLFVCPHVFYHSHLAAFDGPIMGLTVVATYAFARALTSRPWVLGLGLAFGVALASKHNAVFLLPTFALAYGLARLPEWRISTLGLSFPQLPLAFASMALLGPVVLYVTYPYGWHAPLERLGAYYRYHLNHEHYPVDYFGTLYRAPPFPIHFPFVMSAITTPLPILVSGVVGFVAMARTAVDATRNKESELTSRVIPWLVVVSTFVPPAIIAMPSVPIFGGTKHWMTMMPFFCLMAAGMIVRAADRVSAELPRFGRALAVVLVMGLLVLPGIEVVRTHPLGFTYFNELVLGHQGGAALGMPRGFWGGAGRALLAEINTRAARGDAVFSHRMNYDDFRAYQTDGLLRADLRWVKTPDEARWALSYHQREHQDVEYRIWVLRDGDERPLASVAFDGVPIVSLYEIPREQREPR